MKEGCLACSLGSEGESQTRSSGGERWSHESSWWFSPLILFTDRIQGDVEIEICITEVSTSMYCFALFGSV